MLVTSPSDRVLNSRVVAALNQRGPSVVRLLLASSGTEQTAALDGAVTAEGRWIDRADSELWLLRHEAALAGLQAGRLRASHRATIAAAAGAIIATAATVAGVIQSLWL